MAITETMKSVVDFLTNGFNSDKDVFGEIEQELGEEYPMDRNMALAPEPMMEKKERPNLKVVAQHPAAAYSKGYEVMVMEPKAFAECAQVVNNLKENKTIVLNLHLLDKEQQQRTIDFVCGAAQALSAKPKKVGDTVFVFTPSNVTLSFENNTDSNNISEALWNQA